jgi:anti-sigma-K factor RskA
MGDDLAALPKDVTLQLWFVDDAGAMPVGTFQPDEAGHVAICFDAIDPRPYVLGVTMEPMGGSDTPTMPILASA